MKKLIAFLTLAFGGGAFGVMIAYAGDEALESRLEGAGIAIAMLIAARICYGIYEKMPGKAAKNPWSK